MFTIAVDKQPLQEFISNATNEYQVNKDGSTKVKCKKLSGKYILKSLILTT